MQLYEKMLDITQQDMAIIRQVRNDVGRSEVFREKKARDIGVLERKG
jgi:hypothetical protein